MTLRPTDKRQWTALAFLAGVMACCLLVMMALIVRPPAPVIVQTGPLPEPVAVGDGGEKFFGGWVDDPVARQEVLSGLPVGQKYFGETPAFRAFRGDDTSDILLTDAEQEALGHWIPIRDQRDVGSCVSFGTAGAIETLFCVMIVNANHAGQPPPLEYRDLSQEVIYGGSRVEVGKGRVRGDGSVTAWAAEFVKSWGVVARGRYGSLDLTTYDTRRCREFGAKGVPSDLEQIARQSPVKGITFVRNADEAWRAIGQGYPIAIGSGVGFGENGPWQRDKDGFLRASGQWGHCMSIVGRATVGTRKGFLFRNSWGDQVHRGPKGGKNIPDSGCFFADFATVNRMCAEGDAIAFSDAVGFPARNDFFIRAPLPNRDAFAMVGPEFSFAW